MKRKTMLMLWLLWWAASAQGQVTLELERTVRNLHSQDALKHATLCVSVYDASTGQPVYAYDANRSVTPASVMKLLTTGTGFARLGSDFRFTTRLLMRGDTDRDGVLHGDLYIVGGGDPLLGSYRFKQTQHEALFAQWAEAIRKRGIRRIAGSVRFNESLFSGAQQHDSWQLGDVGNYYGAGASALNFHENMYFAYFNAGSSIGDPATLDDTQPRGLGLMEHNQVTTGAAKSGDQVIAYGLNSSNERLYTGTVPLGASHFGVRVAMPHPAASCATLLATYLRKQGIGVDKDTEPAATLPDSVRTLSEYYSPVFRQIAQYTNQTSNNLYAESIFKYLGHHCHADGSFAGGANAITTYLKEKKVEASGVNIVDGSGLSRLNSVTADFLGRYLVMLAREPFFDAFLSSLRTASNPAVHYKTGTMTGVKAQAGYVVANGRKMTYAVIINHAEQASREAAEAVERIVQQIAQLAK